MNRFAHRLILRRLVLALGMAAPLAAVAYPSVAAAEEPQVNEGAVSKIKQFLEICESTPELTEAGKKVASAGLVHKSKLDPNDSGQLNSDSLRFSFKKAHGAAKLYQVKITRVVETKTTGVGFGKTAEKGKLFKYFVAKKDGVDGRPAPVQIFFADGGGEPVLYDWGSF